MVKKAAKSNVQKISGENNLKNETLENSVNKTKNSDNVDSKKKNISKNKAIPLVNADTLEPKITNKTFDPVKTANTAEENKTDLKVSEMKTKLSKNILYTSLVGLLGLMLIVLPIFGGRSLLSRTVGAVNQDAGKVVDTVTNSVLGTGGVDFDKLKNSLGKDDECYSLWDDLKNEGLNYQADSVYKNNLTLKLVNAKNENIAFLNADTSLVGGQVDFQGKLNANLMINAKKINSLQNTLYGNSLDLGEDNIFATLGVIGTMNDKFSGFNWTNFSVNTNAAKINEVSNVEKVKGDELKLYGEKIEQTDEQISAIQKINKASQKLLESKPSQILTDNTGRSLAKLACSGVKDIQVSGLKNNEIKLQEMKDGKIVDTTLDVGLTKKVSIVMDNTSISEAYKKTQNRLNDLLENAKKDEKLKSWLKSNYQSFKEIGEGNVALTNLEIEKYIKEYPEANGIQKQELPEYLKTKEAWDKQIDDQMEGLSKNTAIEQTAQNIKAFSDLINIVNEKTDIYANLKGEVVAADILTKVKVEKGTAAMANFVFGGSVPDSVQELLDSTVEGRVVFNQAGKGKNDFDNLKKVKAENIMPVENLQKDLEAMESVKKFKEGIQPLLDKYVQLTTPLPVETVEEDVIYLDTINPSPASPVSNPAQ